MTNEPAERGVESVEALIGHAVAPEPSAPPQWSRGEARAAKTAPLRIYLGEAPGVGKTYAMLSEGRRRAERGTRVVVACVETYGRPRTLEMLQGLETVAERQIEYRGTTFEEMDTDAVIQRDPEIALVDELAHTNVPGARRGKRWEDVIDLLAADVTGVRQRETVPDWVVELADQIELVDMSPHALQRRMLHGNVYPDPAKAELALQRYFTTDNLTALRELALMRVANQVDETLLSRWSKGRTPETRERVLVCVGEPESAGDLVRRGARIAQRARGDFLVVHARERNEPDTTAWLVELKQLVADLGGELLVIDDEDPVAGVLNVAYTQFVTQLVVGESRRSRWQEILRGSFVTELIRRAANVDIHVIAQRAR
jgi:two-component system sensor histidine kinase KdpD